MRIAVIGKVDDAEATKWTGDPEVDPGAGEVTVTPANEDAASTRIAITDWTAFFTKTFLRKELRFATAGRKVAEHLLWIHQ